MKRDEPFARTARSCRAKAEVEYRLADEHDLKGDFALARFHRASGKTWIEAAVIAERAMGKKQTGEDV